MYLTTYLRLLERLQINVFFLVSANFIDKLWSHLLLEPVRFVSMDL